MIKNAGFDVIKKSLDFSVKSDFPMATRRIIHNFSEHSIEDRGHFHVDVMSGIGSGLVVYQNFRFFLLTAKHNLNQIYPTSLRNESPIWVSIGHPPQWSSMLDFYMARRIWYVGELIKCESRYFEAQDIVLIEFFFPFGRTLPKQFINIEGADYFLRKDEYFENQILICSGFPAKSNSYEELNQHPEYTQSTVVNLEHKFGMCCIEDREEFFRFNSNQHLSHADLNGYSGGPVYSAFYDNSEIKLAGISLSGGGGILRFLPAYIFHDAVASYKEARCEILDPASQYADETEQPHKALALFCEKEQASNELRKKLGLT